jgi:leader peptidase (prepilin peptidase)/N-methyltransferase
LLCSLIVAAFIDWDLQVIPDGCTLPLMMIAPLYSWICGQTWIVPLWFQDSSVVRTLRPALPGWLQPLMFDWSSVAFAQQHPHWHGLLVSLTGLLAGGVLIWLVRVIGVFALHQEAMGFGDVTLMAMVGSVIGWQPVTFVFFLAPIMAVFAAAASWFFRRSRELPYGPWLSLATLLLLVFWKPLWPFAERVFDMGPLVLLVALAMTLCLAVSLQLIQLVKRLSGAGPVERPMTFNDLEEVRAVRRWLGWPVSEPDFGDGGWSSADHLSYYNSARSDAPGSHWPRNQWPGCRSGQGQLQLHQWRTGGR